MREVKLELLVTVMPSDVLPELVLNGDYHI